MRASTASTTSTGETFFLAMAGASSDADIQQRVLSFMVAAIVCSPGGAEERTMKLALNQGLSGAASLSGDIERVLEAERLGYDSVWAAGADGFDAVTSATRNAARTQRNHAGPAANAMARRTP